MKGLMKSRLIPACIILAACGLHGCREIAVPKPKGYFRISLPAKEYVVFNDSVKRAGLPLSFEFPAYGRISALDNNPDKPGWFNIEFPDFKAKIYLTYRDIKGDLPDLIEQTYTMNVKNHITKADAIDEQIISNKQKRIFGVLYELKGNTATSIQFYVTDSTRHYLRGSLYFDAVPNADSLAPVIDFFREDVIHLIETLNWEGK
jgi:gliding motility-associated lipoprotein GldD